MNDDSTSSVALQSRATIKGQFSEHVSSGKVAFFDAAGIDFILGKREGAMMWDIAGEKQLINCHCNGGVFNLGHHNSEIIKTLQMSLEKFDIGNHHLISEPRAELGAKLAELLPGDITFTVFGVSGGEAIDLAIKIARGYTKRNKIISAVGGYHGHTGYALAAGDSKFADPFGVVAQGFVKTPFNDIEALKQNIDKQTAAVIFETIPATLGMPIPDNDFYQNVRELCDKNGALMIIDEIQTGFGRTGKLWGIEHYGAVPDIIALGKGMSGGIYPMSATCFTPKLESVFHQDPFAHISTFGGAEVGCAVALKVLQLSSQPSFLAHVNDLANIFRQGFQQLRQKHPSLLVQLRQLGLMMGIEFTDPQLGPLFTKAAFEAGFFSVYAANDTRVAQFLPPLIIEDAMAVELLERVDAALTLMTKMLQQRGQQ